MKKVLCLATLALVISSCAVTDRKNKLAVATVTGGVAGAFVGWTVFGPGGSGILGSLVVGSLGAGAGYLATDTLLPRERESFHRATYHSLQGMPEGQPTKWTSADTGTTASITPLRSFRAKDGKLCRDFVVVFKIGESRESVKRTACRGVDGSWQTI